MTERRDLNPCQFGRFEDRAALWSGYWLVIDGEMDGHRHILAVDNHENRDEMQGVRWLCFQRTGDFEIDSRGCNDD